LSIDSLDSEHEIPSDLRDERAFAVRLRGDAMEPKISDQDIAILSPMETAFNGEVVLANLKNEGLVCRLIHLQQEGSIIKLSGYNPAYPPLEYRREEFHWIVPIVSIIRNLRFR
jgi:repressor LexA